MIDIYEIVIHKKHTEVKCERKSMMWMQQSKYLNIIIFYRFILKS